MAKDKKKKREERKAKKAAWHNNKGIRAEIKTQVEAFKDRFPLETVKMPERACGGCTGCCTAVAVHELEKPMWQKCQHECAQGCAIYEDRPDSCKKYWCLWQAGMLKGEENRPDKIGIILDCHVESSNVDAISVWELWEGAADQPHVRNILNEIGKRFLIAVRRHNSNRRRFIGMAEVLTDLHVKEIN